MLKERALSICMEKLVVPGRNQKEPSFSLEFFFGKKESLQRFSPFLSFTGIIGISPCHLRYHASTILLDEIRVFLKEKLYCSISRKILISFTVQMESTQKLSGFFTHYIVSTMKNNPLQTN